MAKRDKSSRRGRTSRTRDREEEPRSRGSKRRGSKRGGSSKRNFTYKKRDANAVKKRSTQGAGNRDNIFKDDYKVFKVTEENSIRILPPTWEDPEHYALDIYIHYGIGPDESSFLCLDKVDSDEKCPICEERAKAEAEGDTEYAASLKPTKRPTCYVIDRDNEDEGPMLWAMPWTVDRDLSAQSIDKRTGEVIPLDDPYEGFDVSFSRQGKGMKTKYVGLSIGRHPSEASDDLDTVLDYIQENPIPDTLDIKDADYISQVFAGHSAAKSKEADDEDDKSERDDDLPTWEDVHEMSFDELEELIEDEELDEVIDAEEFDEEDELADAVCEEMGIKKPKAKGSSRDKKKARGMRRGKGRR